VTSIPLILLHGTWSPADRCFFLWGEDAHRFGRKRGRTATKSIPTHPFQAPEGELDLAAPDLPEMTRAFLLPTIPGLGPAPSPQLLLEPDTDPAGDAELLVIAPWNVTGRALRPAAALTWLATLSAKPADFAHRFGPDLVLWSQVAKLALELLMRERFIPTVDPEHDAARWLLLFDAGDDRDRLNALIQSLPPASLALLPPRVAPGEFQPLDPQALVMDCMQTAADALIREWLGDPSPGDSAQNYLQAPRMDDSLADEWVAALAAPDPTMLVVGDMSPSIQAIQDWAEPALDPGRRDQAPAPFRTCIRLEPPPDDDSEDGTPWTLRVLLQALDDPSLLIPASDIWRERGATVRYLNRRFDHPQERLLMDMGVAARLFPPLEQLLQSAHPEVCSLSVTDTYRFLTAGAHLLRENGMGVLLPFERNNKPAVSVRARVKSPRSAKNAGLGLAQLLDVDWDLALGDQPLRMKELKRLAQLKLPLIRIRGQWVELDPEQIARLLSMMDRPDSRITVGAALKLALGGVEPVTGLPVTGMEAEGAVADLIDRLSGQGRPVDLPAPQGLRGQLRPYQLRGVSWLAFLRSFGIGACLADDMGLGKTVQVIALLLHERETGESGGPTLLVCPTSLVGNWQRELARFAPTLKVLVHHGADRLRGDDFARTAGEHDVVISTYALVHRDLAHVAPVAWGGIVLDEAQNIKNAEARQSQSLRSLAAGYRIALTGTPVENRLSELWSLMDFLNPGYLGSSAEFHNRFSVPIERNGDGAAASRLRSLVQPFVLRRVKTDPTVIQDLPEKLEQPVFVNLTPEQASLYAAVVADMLSQIDVADGIQRRGLVLAALTKLKQICNHPAHFLGDRSALPDRSGKLNRLEEMLEEALAEGDHALIFTQYAEMGELLQQHLATVFGQEVLFLHGRVRAAERAQMVERFQQSEGGPPLFILTLKAGGVGLNLTRANHVFHFDRWWNPAVENQATDRAFRIGQKRNVMVHQLITAGTVEEKIDAIIAGKRQLAEQVVSAGEDWLTELTTDQLRTLFTLEQE
jgi:SNF2 family DNA or RNA helicase